MSGDVEVAVTFEDGRWRLQQPAGQSLELKTLDNLSIILQSSSLVPIQEFRSRFRLGHREVLRVPTRIETPSLSWLQSTRGPTGHDYTIEELLTAVTAAHRIPLYPFQQEGAQFLYGNERALLADEMGLGKTIQAIAASMELIGSGAASRVLVVTPKSLAFNWIDQFQRWAPSLATSLVMPSGRAAPQVWPNRVGRAWVIVTTYEQVRRFPPLIANHAELVIADEAHRLRNANSQTTKGLRAIAKGRLWLLSGTPVERDSKDLAQTMSLLLPKRFARRDATLPNSVLRERSRPSILRRSVTDVLTDLPAVVERHEVLPLSGDQAKSYSVARQQRSISALQTFGRLRAISDLDPVTGSSTKIDRAVSLLEQIRSIEESAVVFSFWRSPLRELRRRLETQGHRPLVIDAQQSAEGRQTVVDSFEHVGGILLASGHVAGEGLTLVKANHAIFLNRWWNPSKNDQAVARIRRIGQPRTSFVYTFTCAGTVDELIDSMLQRKAVDQYTLIQMLETPFARTYL